jgi:hypothetical protein
VFDRFTQRAIQVLFYARAEASQLGSSAVEPEHILLGVLDEGHGLGGRILARTGHAVDDVRQDIVRRLTGGEKVPPSNEILFSPSCQRALQYAAEEADRLAHDHVGAEHLLPGGAARGTQRRGRRADRTRSERRNGAPGDASVTRPGAPLPSDGVTLPGRSEPPVVFDKVEAGCLVADAWTAVDRRPKGYVPEDGATRGA